MAHVRKCLRLLNLAIILNLLLLTARSQQGNNTILTYIDTPMRSKPGMMFALLLPIGPTTATTLITTVTPETQITPKSNITPGCKTHRNGLNSSILSLITELQNSNGIVKFP